jgi:hypothetical protein
MGTYRKFTGIKVFVRGPVSRTRVPPSVIRGRSIIRSTVVGLVQSLGRIRQAWRSWTRRKLFFCIGVLFGHEGVCWR